MTRLTNLNLFMYVCVPFCSSCTRKYDKFRCVRGRISITAGHIRLADIFFDFKTDLWKYFYLRCIQRITNMRGRYHFVRLFQNWLICPLLFTGAWSTCYRAGCGPGGETTRVVDCKVISASGSIGTTRESNCNHLQKPPERQECFKTCREHLYEVRWAWTPWQECRLEPGVKVCARGRGIAYRNVSCVWKENGKLEKDAVCESFEEKPPTMKRCELRCRQDCVVTGFSPWSSCDNCRILNKTRMRRILVPDSNGGKMCPAFSELLPCYNCSEMYFLSVDVWSPCSQFSSAVSSQHPNHPVIGSQRRTIKCVNTYGALVNWRWEKQRNKYMLNHAYH